jgi:hypothetical protein
LFLRDGYYLDYDFSLSLLPSRLFAFMYFVPARCGRLGIDQQ